MLNGHLWHPAPASPALCVWDLFCPLSLPCEALVTRLLVTRLSPCLLSIPPALTPAPFQTFSQNRSQADLTETLMDRSTFNFLNKIDLRLLTLSGEYPAIKGHHISLVSPAFLGVNLDRALFPELVLHLSLRYQFLTIPPHSRPSYRHLFSSYHLWDLRVEGW